MSQQQQPQQTSMIVRTQQYLEAKVTELQRWTVGGVRAEALQRYALLELQLNNSLRDATPQSVYMALLACASMGLVPGTVKNEVYLIPFSRKDGNNWVKEVKALVGWRGLQKQVLRCPEVKGLHSDVVYEHDHFELQLGTAAAIDHRPFTRGDRGAIVGAYAYARFNNGFLQIEYQDIERLNRVRDFADSKAKARWVNGKEVAGRSEPWHLWFDAMARKTAIRSLAKFCPVGEDYFLGVQLDEARYAGEEGDGPSDAEVIDLHTDGAVTRSRTGDVGTLAAALPASQEAPRPARGKAARVEAGAQEGKAAPTPVAAKPPATSSSPASGPASATTPIESPSTAASSGSGAGPDDGSAADGAPQSLRVVADEPEQEESRDSDDGFPPFDDHDTSTSPPARSLEGLLAWLEGMTSTTDTASEEGKAWSDWVKEQEAADPAWHRGDPRATPPTQPGASAAAFSKAYARKWTELKKGTRK